MDIQAAYREVGTYRGAADICGTTPKTVRRVVKAAERELPVPRPHNYDEVTDLVAERVKKTEGRISAKRLLPVARAAGYEGSARNLPSSRRPGEGIVANRQPSWPAPRRVGSRRCPRRRLGRDRSALRLLRRARL